MRRSWFPNIEHTRLWDDPSWSHCEELIKEFEAAWRRGTRPRIADYLGVDGPERLALLVELVHVEMEFRFKSGDPVRTENYLTTFPELAKDRSAILSLIAAEFELRQM